MTRSTSPSARRCYWSDTASLPIFLACYFATLVAAWYAAVKIAERMKLTT